MQKYIINHNLKKYVKLKNFTDNPFRLIKESDIFILSSNYEGLPNVLLEAACFKKANNFNKMPNRS